MILRPIGHIETPFATLADCPRHGRQLDPAPVCTAVVAPEFQPGLLGLDGFSHLILLYWLGPQADALTIVPPFDGQTRGVFATRAPLRPNPIGVSVVAFDGSDGAGRAETAMGAARHQAQAVSGRVKEQPFVAVLIAAAIGFLAARVLR